MRIPSSRDLDTFLWLLKWISIFIIFALVVYILILPGIGIINIIDPNRNRVENYNYSDEFYAAIIFWIVLGIFIFIAWIMRKHIKNKIIHTKTIIAESSVVQNYNKKNYRYKPKNLEIISRIISEKLNVEFSEISLTNKIYKDLGASIEFQ